MIYILCANPSLDVFMEVKDFQLGGLHRCDKQEILVGGKGINVAYILKQLGVSSVLLGFISGKIGKTIQEMVHQQGLQEAFLDVENGESRINVKLYESLETQINGAGPKVSVRYQDQLCEQINALKKDDILVISGSYPPGIQEDFLKKVGTCLRQKGCKLVVDQSKQALLESLNYHPFLIKPNKEEVEEIFHVKIKDKQKGFFYGKKLQELGAQNVLMSFGKDGALFLGENQEEYDHPGLEGICKSSIGAGDSMLAGFLAGYLLNQDKQEAFASGIAAGSATAFAHGLANQEEIHTCLDLVNNSIKMRAF